MGGIVGSPSGEEAEVLDQLRDRLHSKAGMGVTLIGNRLTLRWTDPKSKQLVDVHLIIAEVGTPTEMKEHMAKYARRDAEYAKLKKNQKLTLDEFREMEYRIEHGESSK